MDSGVASSYNMTEEEVMMMTKRERNRRSACVSRMRKKVHSASLSARNLELERENQILRAENYALQEANQKIQDANDLLVSINRARMSDIAALRAANVADRYESAVVASNLRSHFSRPHETRHFVNQEEVAMANPIPPAQRSVAPACITGGNQSGDTSSESERLCERTDVHPAILNTQHQLNTPLEKDISNPYNDPSQDPSQDEDLLSFLQIPPPTDFERLSATRLRGSRSEDHKSGLFPITFQNAAQT